MNEPIPEPDPRTLSRRSDPWTSKEAAYVVNTGTMAYSVLLCHYVHREGLTDDEMSVCLAENGIHVHDRSDRKRRGELERNGYLEDSGQTRKSESGLEQVVWRITALGKRRIEEDLRELIEKQSPVPAQKKPDPTMNKLRSYLRSIRFEDPF